LSRASFSERELHSIEDGRWVSKIPSFHVAVPSYQQKAVAGSRGGEYTIFRIVSSVPLPPSTVANRASAGSGRASDNIEKEDDNDPELQYKQITVERRYTHFQHLHTVLRTSLPLVSVPDLPEKRLTGNFTKDFLDVRRRDLERFLRRLACHPLVRSHRTFLDFLGNEDEQVRARLSSDLPVTPGADRQICSTRHLIAASPMHCSRLCQPSQTPFSPASRTSRIILTRLNCSMRRPRQATVSQCMSAQSRRDRAWWLCRTA
jgi:hypothetical protein